MRRGRAIVAVVVGLALSVVSSPASSLPSGDSPGRKHSTVKRLSIERLRAAHADIEALARLRRPVAAATGLTDFRAILHAHAEDSAHTGGTLAEMHAAAKRAGVSAIFLSDHLRPPRDFMDGWRGLRDGVLYVPGSEAKGFLLHPERSVMHLVDGPKDALIAEVTRGDGLAFLSHIEDRRDHPMTGLTGMEIYNRHADAMDDAALLLVLMRWMTDPTEVAALEEKLRLFPDEVLGAQLDYPSVYFEKWDRETRARRVVGVAANDCHHNQVLIVKMVDAETVLIGTNVDDDDEMRRITAKQRPSIRELVKGHRPGDEVVRLDFDPYHVFFRDVSTHILAPELTETALRRALAGGHAYVAHDFLGDPEGFAWIAERGGRRVGILGDEVRLAPGLRLVAEAPLPCRLRVLRDGEPIREATGEGPGRRLEIEVDEVGVYRVEAWVAIDGEERPWIYANPIYVRPAKRKLY